MKQDSLEIEWAGPYGWPNYESGIPAIPAHTGVYLQTFEYQNGYLIYAAGITRRTIPKRFREHTRHYMTGVYNVLDAQALTHGIRTEVWHGFWGYPRSAEKLAEYEERRSAINDAVAAQFRAYRIFTANIGKAPRILERLEAAIMFHLYKQSPPFCDVPDKGMMLAPRWSKEPPVIVTNACSSLLHTLPSALAI